MLSKLTSIVITIITIIIVSWFSPMNFGDTYLLNNKTIDEYLNIINDDINWDIARDFKISITPSDTVFQVVELLGAIRCDDDKLCMAIVNRIDNLPTGIGPLRGFRDYFVHAAIVKIDSPTLDMLIKTLNETNIDTNVVTILTTIMPYDSILAIIQSYKKHYNKDKKFVTNMDILEKTIKDHRKFIIERRTSCNPYTSQFLNECLPDLHHSTLNHPLYKARQATIKSNLELAQRILAANKNLALIDSDAKLKLLGAIEELAKVRAVEAIEVIVPVLLLQSDKENADLDKKYFSLRKYPVGVALVKIGIPSIWGLLDEIAKHSGNDSDEYRKIACDVMSSILIKKAIPGFVNEQLIKYKDNELAQIRLAKLLLLLAEDITKIELLKPQFRIWKSSDGLFETRAKFISIDKKNDVTLEKENGKQTTIEFPALQKTDQDYVKEFITINKK